MMFIFDTSSLVSLSRYYLPFDHQGKIYSHVKQSLENGRIILIDAVHEECRFVAKKVVMEKLEFLSEKSYLKQHNLPVRTKDIIPATPVRFYNMVENNFTTPAKNRLSDIEFENLKREWLVSADAKILIYVYNHLHENTDTEISIVTEETSQANDNKAFKKIPIICNQLGFACITLPDYLTQCDDLDMNLG